MAAPRFYYVRRDERSARARLGVPDSELAPTDCDCHMSLSGTGHSGQWLLLVRALVRGGVFFVNFFSSEFV
jgi:hypothetical protein